MILSKKLDKNFKRYHSSSQQLHFISLELSHWSNLISFKKLCALRWLQCLLFNIPPSQNGGLEIRRLAGPAISGKFPWASKHCCYFSVVSFRSNTLFFIMDHVFYFNCGLLKKKKLGSTSHYLQLQDILCGKEITNNES